MKLQRTTPYYKRNRAHVCSFYVRGQCTRGLECPYRHEMPETGELSQQNIKDRYYGVNDPVALKLLNKAGEMPSLEPPNDESIKTLYVGGVDARITEQDLRDQFYAHGEIESVKMVLQRGCAFVTYTTREGAERAAEELANKLVIKGLRLKLLWGRPQAPKPESEMTDELRQQAAVAHGGLLPRAVISQQQNQPDNQDQPPYMPYFNIPHMPQPEREHSILQWILKEWEPLFLPKMGVQVQELQDQAKIEVVLTSNHKDNISVIHLPHNNLKVNFTGPIIHPLRPPMATSLPLHHLISSFLHHPINL
nr:zinc finger CCCH domain-containing protein 49-like [Ipomoea batatas]